MDIDEVFDQIGAFGFSQKKIYYLLNLVQVFLGFHALSLSFIGSDPGWTCEEYSDIKNQSLLCPEYELGQCKPQFSPAYTSIVTEVPVIQFL